MREKALELGPVRLSSADCKLHELSDFSSIETLVRDRFGDTGFGVFYLDNEVLVGKYDGEKFCFYKDNFPRPKFLQKMRLFNLDKELLLWRKKWQKDSGIFASRLRVDNEGQQIEAVDAWQLLWGKVAILNENFIELLDARGMKINIPLKDTQVDNGERLFIKTRNYITYETGESNINLSEPTESDTDEISYMQASYFDSRFVSFTNKDRKLLGW